MEKYIKCPHCGEERNVEIIEDIILLDRHKHYVVYLCNVCSKTFQVDENG